MDVTLLTLFRDWLLPIAIFRDIRPGSFYTYAVIVDNGRPSVGRCRRVRGGGDGGGWCETGCQMHPFAVCTACVLCANNMASKRRTPSSVADRVMHGRNLRPVRGVPVPPLFGLGVPYLHFSGEKVENLLSTEAILIIIIIMLVYYAMTNRNAVQIKY